MFRFAYPEYLYLLLIVPALLLFYVFIVKARKKALKRYGTPELIAALTPDASPKRMRLKYFLLLAAITVVIFIVAGPQFGSKLETVKRQGIEVMVCLDVSNSMLAQDITPNRLEKAKQMLARLTDDLHNDKMGLIVFAGDAFTQLPITSDYISAKMFLSSINPSMVSTQGTAVAAAINLALRSFTPDEKASKAIILITDGEDHEGDAVQAATTAAEKGVKVNIVGIGLPQGAPIPVSDHNDYMKDNAGNVVITQLNETICKELAQAGNGLYVRADNTNSALKTLQSELNKMSKSEVESQVYSEYDEQFPTLAWIVLTLLVVEFIIAERKNRLFGKIKLFSDASLAEGEKKGRRSTMALTIVILMLCAFSTAAQKAERKHVRDGNKQYQQEKFTEAEIDYRKGIEVNPRSVEGAFNLGNALYKQEKYKEAAEQYQLTIGQGERLIKEDPANIQRLAQTFHNMGNISMKSQEYQKSIDAYKQSLRLNPNDEETRYNLALAQKLLKDQQQQQQDQQDQDQNKDQEQQQDQKQDQNEKQDQQEQKQDQQQEQKQQEQEQQKTQEQQQQNEQMSRDNAQQMLDAFLQDEKDTQEKVKKAQMQQQQSRKKEKQW